MYRRHDGKFLRLPTGKTYMLNRDAFKKPEQVRFGTRARLPSLPVEGRPTTIPSACLAAGNGGPRSRPCQAV